MNDDLPGPTFDPKRDGIVLLVAALLGLLLVAMYVYGFMNQPAQPCYSGINEPGRYMRELDKAVRPGNNEPRQPTC